MSIATELTTLNSTKLAIKQALIDKGVDLTGTVFAGYAQKITDLPTGGGGSSQEWTQAYYDSVLAAVPAWIRPATWLAMPTLATRGFVGLRSVRNTTNEVVALVGIGGAYTVDWGDGVVEYFADGVQANHQYTYANVSNDTLQPDGSKQVIVKVYPQVGQQFTSINLNVRFTGRTVTYETQWLDIYLTTDATSTMPQFGNNSSGTVNIYMNEVERIFWESGTVYATSAIRLFSNLRNLNSISVPSLQSVTDMTSMFQNCYSLQTILLLNTAAVTDMTSMFQSCHSLQTIPLLNTVAVKNMNNMFSSCYSLQTIPLLNTTDVITMGNMFSGCFSLQTIPLLSTAAVTNMNNMFSSCHSLQTIPLLSTAAVKNMNNMFSSCYSLQTIPLLNTTAVTNMSYMFSNCLSLQTIPLLNTVVVTTMSSMFQSCYSLQTIPSLNTAAVTNMSNMFINCYSLQTIPLLNTVIVTNMSYMFQNCHSLQEVKLNSADLNTTTASMFSNCSSLARIQVPAMKLSFSVANCSLSAEALNEIYTNLPTVTGRTITVTGNFGTASDNPSIATAKGWTVTG